MTLLAEDPARHPSLRCFDRLNALALQNSAERPWHELTTDTRIGLCRGSTSTAPVDCLVGVHTTLVRLASTQPPPRALVQGSARLLEFSARVCSGRAALHATAAECLAKEFSAGSDLRTAALACRRQTPSSPAAPVEACVAKFAPNSTVVAALNQAGVSFSAADSRSLCAGATVPSRPAACVQALLTSFSGLPTSASTAHSEPTLEGSSARSAAFSLCRGNDDPKAAACFQEAVKPALAETSVHQGLPLSHAQAARLCGALD